MSENSIQKSEEHFHDEWAAGVEPSEVMVDEFFEACTSPENRWIFSEIKPVKGKKILELGCGNGEASVYFAKQGAEVTALDISGGMLKLASAVAARHGVSIRTLKCSASEIPGDKDIYDLVYAANLLHHVELEPTFREVRRVLKPAGRFVSWDPLAHNPLINIYRKMAWQVRTEDEHPLKMKDIKLFRRYFSNVRIHTTWFFTLWLFVRFYLKGLDPNKERYWKKILTDHRELEPLYNRLERLDRYVLKALPFLNRFCWNMVFIGEKE